MIRLCLGIAAVIGLVTASLLAAPKAEVFRENAVLPVDGELLKRFGTVEDLLADRRWDEAISRLQEIAQKESKSLVLVQPGKSGKFATYVNVMTRCNLLLCRIPAEGRAAYRQKVDPQAKRWYENWLRTRDEEELLRIVRQAFLSSYGDDAVLALGEAAWDRGDFSAAGLWWEQLNPLPADADPADYPTVLRYPDPSYERPAILARILICSILEGSHDRAAMELRQFAEQYPLTEGWLCGKQGRYVDLIQRTLDDSLRWERVPPSAEVATFAMSSERCQTIPESVDIGALRWSHALPPNLLPSAPDKLNFRTAPLSYHPVVHDKIVFVNDSEVIRAWNILTGEPAWQSERRDSAAIYPTVPDEGSLPHEKTCIGTPHYTMTISDNRLYARMGSAVTCSSTAELRRDESSDLVCLDLLREGKLLWKITAHELLGNDPSWRFEGSPLVVKGRAYVALCRRHQQLELLVACLDASDGRLLWQRPVGAFRASVDDAYNRVSHLLLTAGGGRVFLSTDVGAVIALNALDGRLEWAISYESRTDDAPTAPANPVATALTPPVFHAGRLFVAPSDSDSAFWIEADSGRVQGQYQYLQRKPDVPDALRQEPDRLRRREKKWHHLLGIVPGGLSGRLIVSGYSLWSIDIETGLVVWERPLGNSSRGSRGDFGRGLIAGGQVFVPTRESIEVFDSSNGNHLRQVPLKTPNSSESGGNLTLASGMLLVAGPQRLAAYCEYARLKERIERELTERPNDVPMRIQLAELEMSEGRRDEGMVRFREALGRMDRDDPAWFTVRRKLTRLLQEAGNNQFAHQQAEAARENWQEALAIADDVTKRVDLLFDLARVDESLDEPASAAKRFQTVLNENGLATVRRGNQTAGQAASDLISKLIEKFGKDVYGEIEVTATEELKALTESKDARGLQRWILKYPQSVSSTKARQVLVRLFSQSGLVSEAYAVNRELEHGIKSEQEAVEFSLSTIRLLRDAGYSHATRRAWQRLAARPTSIEITYEGKTHDLATLARSELQHSSRQHPHPSFLERTWSREIGSISNVIFPRNNAPAPELDSVLVSSKQSDPDNPWKWQCVDWQSGKVRWEESSPDPISAAAWTAVHLMIGTRHGWQARSPETGRRIWDQVLLADNEPRVIELPDGGGELSSWPAVMDPKYGLQFFDPDNGNPLAAVKLPGRLHSVIGVDRELKNGDGDEGALRSSPQMVSLFLQTVKPQRTWRASAQSPRDLWTMEELPTGGALWQGPPAVLGAHVVGVTDGNFLSGTALNDPSQAQSIAQPFDRLGKKGWVCNSLATGQGPPILAPGCDDLLVVVDGMRLASFDSMTGSRKWTTDLADFPMNAPADQTVTDGSHVYAVSQGWLRKVSSNTGQLRLVQYLGETAPQWRTAVAWISRAPDSGKPPSGANSSAAQCLVAAWPIELPGPRNRHVIRLCDSETGAIWQQLQTDGEPKELIVRPNGFGLLWAKGRLSGLKFSTANLVVEASAKPPS